MQQIGCFVSIMSGCVSAPAALSLSGHKYVVRGYLHDLRYQGQIAEDLSFWETCFHLL